MKLKICGMREPGNILEVAGLQPDYMGFIFYKGSRRFLSGDIPVLQSSIKKTGVFVNADAKEIQDLTKIYDLQAVQLHGDESESYCQELKKLLDPKIELIKAYSMHPDFKMETLESYEKIIDYYLFDTKGKERGGTGKQFDWGILSSYKLDKPYFLSGGIGPDHIPKLQEFLNTEVSKFCYAIDVNSKFEIEPGLKKTEALKEFIKMLERISRIK